MIRDWLARVFMHRHTNGNAAAATQAREVAERKRIQAERLWPRTEEARDKLAELIENALRGNR